MKRVAILGCGPAGLLAAHAARLMGHQSTIFSRKRKSPMLGAQYMHKAIPSLNLAAPQKLAYVLYGDVDDYRRKVYGDEDVMVSPELFSGFYEAWSIRQAYDQLWHQYGPLVTDCQIDDELIIKISSTFDAVLSTIPAPILCYQKDKHQFKSVIVQIDSKWRGPERPISNKHFGCDNIVICNGSAYDPAEYEKTGWYRTSLIYGHANTEWTTIGSYQVLQDTAMVPKPIATDCNCWPGIVRAGRYGAWKKGILSHEAFDLALEVL